MLGPKIVVGWVAFLTIGGGSAGWRGRVTRGPDRQSEPDRRAQDSSPSHLGLLLILNQVWQPGKKETLSHQILLGPAGKVTSLCECVVQVDNVRAAVDNDGGKFGFEPEFLQRIVVSAAATDLLPQSPQSTIRRPVRDRVRPLLVHRHHLPPVAPGGAGPLQGHGR